MFNKVPHFAYIGQYMTIPRQLLYSTQAGRVCQKRPANARERLLTTLMLVWPSNLYVRFASLILKSHRRLSPSKAVLANTLWSKKVHFGTGPAWLKKDLQKRMPISNTKLTQTKKSISKVITSAWNLTGDLLPTKYTKSQGAKISIRSWLSPENQWQINPTQSQSPAGVKNAQRKFLLKTIR